MASPLPPEIQFIERLNLVLGAGAAAAGYALRGRPGLLAAGAGAVLACADFWVLVRLGRRALALFTGGGTRGQAARLAVLLLLKLMGLFALLWVVVGVAHLPVVPFALGLSVFVVSILVLGVRQALWQSLPRQPASTEEHEVQKQP